MKYYLISGEASGDLHGANLMKALQSRDPQAEFRFWGGDLMTEVGGTNVSHFKERAYMGFLEVVQNLGSVLGFIQQCKKDLLEHRPDVLILIDYPGFNLRIAQFAHGHGIPVHYYISPQIWAWKENRIHKIKKYVDHMYVILPFEKDYYAGHDFKVNFVGHPLLDAISGIERSNDFKNRWDLDDRPIIALLPGSRKQEIKAKLPVMLKMTQHFPDYQFVVAGAPGLEKKFYSDLVSDLPFQYTSNDTYQLLMHATAALVTSGTATLETALFEVPEVVCYRGSTISYWIARQLVKIKYISLVNLVMDRELVKELIQNDFNESNLRQELSSILPDGAKRDTILQGYTILKEKLGGKGASNNTAQLIINSLDI